MAQNMTKDFYVGISTAALLLLLLLCTAVFTSYILMKKKSGSLSVDTINPQFLQTPLNPTHVSAATIYCVSSPVTPFSGWLNLLQLCSNFIFSVRLLESPVTIRMHSQVLVSGLLLLLPAAVGSFPEVRGVVGHPVTLPCSYPVSDGIAFMCWDRGECRDICRQTLIWTDGHRVYYRADRRYKLRGQLLQGNVSLTIENATERDSGLYCCRVTKKGWNGVQRLTTSLQVQPVYTETVTSSRCPWNKHTEAVPTPHALMIPTKGLYIGISVSVGLLLLTGVLMILTSVYPRAQKTGGDERIEKLKVEELHFYISTFAGLQQYGYAKVNHLILAKLSRPAVG
uniref:hepatitis A virus cellular receptor 1 homolog n=1 Tax=Myodes glareolus TaxID=447135 RepID=UPI0020204D6E|nr:hepatitis A virus cellular receptor 1 homolog [Myodes glareolus]